MLVALLTASGGHWIVLQSVAWGTMIVDYSRTSRFCEAVSKTFDGKHPCALCKSIEKTRNSENKSGVPMVIGKLDVFWQRGAGVSLPRLSHWEYPPFRGASELRTHSPLLQPPRALPG